MMVRQKFITVQYLRGLAAVLVLASHALLYPLIEHNLAFSRLGWLGVIIFFVISGFIMVAITGEERFSGLDFLRRRFIRVVPMYWIATLLAAGIALVAPQFFKTMVFDGPQLLLSLLFIPFHNPASGGLHPIYKLGWTLNYEIFFYVCFALLAFLSAGRRVIWLTVLFSALAIVGALFQPNDAIPQFYTNFMPLAFCAGAWIGLATLRGKIAKLPTKWLYLASAIGLVGLIEGFALDRAGLLEDGLAFIGLAAFSTVLLLLAIRLENRLPHVALLEKIGDASYSIYLVHIYEVAILSGVAFKMLDPGDLWADYFVAGVSIIGGTAAGLIVYKYVEQPLLRLTTRTFGQHRPKPVPVPAE